MGFHLRNLISIQYMIVLMDNQNEIGPLIPLDLGKTDVKIPEFPNHFTQQLLLFHIGKYENGPIGFHHIFLFDYQLLARAPFLFFYSPGTQNHHIMKHIERYFNPKKLIEIEKNVPDQGYI